MATAKLDRFDSVDTELAEIARALAHPARIAILRFLAGRETCICRDIVSEVPLAQATVSQHLKVLKSAGLIVGEIDGPRSCYCIDQHRLGKARDQLGRLFESMFHSGTCC
jgi:DNA-binding transcriptional ArsR family regulator